MKLEFDDVSYTLSPVSMGVLLDAETHIRQTDDTLSCTARQVADVDDPFVKSILLENAFRHAMQPVAIDDVAAWLETPHGVLFAFWYALKVYHKDMALEEAESVFARMTREQFKEVREEIFEKAIYAPVDDSVDEGAPDEVS